MAKLCPFFPHSVSYIGEFKKNVSIVLLHMVNLSSGSLPRPQTHKIKQAANICEILGHSLELSEFQRGTMIGCHLCNKLSCEIFSPLNIPQLVISGIITMWKRVGVTTAQPQSDRPSKVTEHGQQVCSTQTSLLFSF